MNTERELSYREFIMRENENYHAPYLPEFDFYLAVKTGDVNKVTHLCEEPFAKKGGLGTLSANPLQNMKYHLAITIALIARYCIEGGMEHEMAYSLSDLYIQKTDLCTTLSAISRLHTEMSIDYTQRMAQLRKIRIYSKPVVKCIDYIYDNLHTRILLSQLAEYVNVNASYLSKLFKKETGITITEYIQIRKIEAAKNMLKYSEFSPSEIASLLAFPNQSYFIELFRKKTGMTPKKYQNQYFRKTGIQSSDPDFTSL